MIELAQLHDTILVFIKLVDELVNLFLLSLLERVPLTEDLFNESELRDLELVRLSV